MTAYLSRTRRVVHRIERGEDPDRTTPTRDSERGVETSVPKAANREPAPGAATGEPAEDAGPRTQLEIIDAILGAYPHAAGAWLSAERQVELLEAARRARTPDGGVPSR